MNTTRRDRKKCPFNRGVRFTVVRLAEVKSRGNDLRSAGPSENVRIKENKCPY